MSLDGRVRVERPHDDTPGWANDDGVQFHQVIHDASENPQYRDALGRVYADRRGWHRWLPFRCNNSDCEFRAWVNATALESTIAGWIEDAASPEPS